MIKGVFLKYSRLISLKLLAVLSIGPAVQSWVTIALPFQYTQQTEAKDFDWNKAIHWDWEKIDYSWEALTEFFKQKNFVIGTATSAFQIEGTQSTQGKECQNSWTMHAECKEGKTCTAYSTGKHPFYHKEIQQPGHAVHHWDNAKQDIQLIKDAGLTAYRFSIEWSKLEPELGIFDLNVLKHYEELIDELLKNNITPIVCLFHHAWPAWFDKKGGFEKKENIRYFVDFAEYLFEKLGHKVRTWMTFNEPVGYVFEGYFRGNYPPFKKGISNLKTCGYVIRNMLNAHVDIYHTLHSHDTKLFINKTSQPLKIGYPHIFMPLDTYSSLNFLDAWICKTFNYLLHDSALDFFKTGKFKWKAPFIKVTCKNPDAVGALDFLAINYYTHTVIKFFQNNAKNHERSLYPEGLYRSIKKAAEWKKCPQLAHVTLHIGENGTNENAKVGKDEFFRKHLYAVKRAMEEGIELDGFFTWTLIDSFSWKKGEDSCMGIYNKERTLYPSMQGFVEFAKAIHNSKISEQIV